MSCMIGKILLLVAKGTGQDHPYSSMMILQMTFGKRTSLKASFSQKKQNPLRRLFMTLSRVRIIPVQELFTNTLS
jgi:hypothetical protein